MRKLTQEELSKSLKDLEIYGFTVIPDFLSDLELEKVKDELHSIFNQSGSPEYKSSSEHNFSDKMVYNLQNKNKLFIDLLSAPSLEHILKEKLNDPWYQVLPNDQPNYILSYYNARSSGDSLPLHNDSYIPNVGPHTWAMQAVFILDDFNEDNGCTIIVPGSHQSGKFSDRSLPNSSCTKLTAKARSLVLWDSRTWHGTLENKSKKDRWALIATITQWWVKQSMDMTRTLPQKIYQELSNEQKRLLGFCSIPPKDENERIITKTNFDYLKENVADYYL